MNDQEFERIVREAARRLGGPGRSESLRHYVGTIPGRHPRSPKRLLPFPWPLARGLAGLAIGVTLLGVVVVGLMQGSISKPMTSNVIPPSAVGSPASLRITCTDIDNAACDEASRALNAALQRLNRRATSAEISSYYVCLADPFRPISCPETAGFFASAQAELDDGTELFLNFIRTGASVTTESRIVPLQGAT